MRRSSSAIPRRSGVKVFISLPMETQAPGLPLAVLRVGEAEWALDEIAGWD
jgi:hypothetical protein